MDLYAMKSQVALGLTEVFVSGQPGNAGAANEVSAPTLTDLADEIFETTCAISGYHVGSTARGGVNLLGNSHESLVGSPAEGAPALIRIVASDPDAFYIIEKLSSETPTAAGQRPPAVPRFTGEQLDPIPAWIAASAKKD